MQTLRWDSNKCEGGGEGSEDSKVTHLEDLEQTSKVEAEENTPSEPPVFDEKGRMMEEDDVTVAVPPDESSKQLIPNDDAMEAATTNDPKAANAATQRSFAWLLENSETKQSKGSSSSSSK